MSTNSARDICVWTRAKARTWIECWREAWAKEGFWFRWSSSYHAVWYSVCVSQHFPVRSGTILTVAARREASAWAYTRILGVPMLWISQTGGRWNQVLAKAWLVTFGTKEGRQVSFLWVRWIGIPQMHLDSSLYIGITLMDYFIQAKSQTLSWLSRYQQTFRGAFPSHLAL